MREQIFWDSHPLRQRVSRPDYCNAPDFRRGFALLEKYGLSFELQVFAGQVKYAVELIKAFTDRARPFNLLRETRVIGRHEPGLSFPSGHAAQTFLVVALTISHFQLPLGIATVLYSIAALVGFTRIYVGAHYPRDVIAGIVLGSVWGILAILVAPDWLGLQF